MNSELQKFIKEPLVWVGAIALCVPLLASGTLTNIRNMLTFESDPVETSFEKMESTEIKLADRAEVPVDTDWKKSNVSDLPPLPSSSSEADILDNAHASLPTKKPGVSSSLDPGSLLPEMRLYEDDEVNEEVADEKIADDDLSDRQVAGVESADEEMSDEETADSVASKSDEPELDFLFGDEPDLQEEEKPQAAEMATNVPQTPQDESSPDWLFSETDLSAQPSSDQPNLTEFDPISSLPGMPAEPALAPYSHLPAEPALAPYSHLPAEPQLAPYSALPYSPEPELAPYSTLPYSPEQELVPIMPQPATPIEIVSQPHSIVGDAFQSDYFIEVDAGPDWWTPYCQQPFWGAIPTQQTGLDAVIFSALQNSPFVKLINTEPQMAQTLVDEADAKFDWSAFVESSWSDVDRPVVSLLDTGTAGGRFVQQQFLYESGVQKNLRRGGHLRVGHAWQRTDNNSSFLSPPDQATAQILLDYRQPLLRGAGKHVNNSQVVLAQFGVESAHNDTQAALQQFLVDVVAEYWQLHYARGVLVQKMRSAERAEQLFHEISNLNANGSRQRDLLRIQAAATARRTDLIRAQNTVATHQEKLMNLTHGTTMPNPASLEIVPMEAPGTFMVPYDLNLVTEMAVQNRPEVQVALTAIKASAVRQNLALNDLRPQLDAVVSTFISGVDEDKDVGGAFSDAKNFNPSYAVGFTFEVPIGNRAANSRLQRQQLDYQRLQNQLEQTLGNVRLDARLAYRDVQSLANELENHKLASQQAAQELQAVTQKTASELSTNAANTSLLIDDLLQSQARLANAEERLLRSQTDMSVALVQLKRATGQLLQTAPMPQAAGHTVQQVSYEQPVQEQQLWTAPNTAPQQQMSVLDDLWTDGP